MNSRGVVAGFLVVVAFVCSAGVLISYQETTALRERGLAATGEVVEVHHGFGRASSSYVRVRFEDREGAAIDARVYSDKWAGPQPGDEVEVLYDPLHPHHVVGAGIRPDFVATWLWGLGGLAALAVIRPTWTGRLDWRKLSRR